MPIPGLIPGILGGLSSIGSSMIQARAAKQTAEMTNRANRELAEYGYSKDLEMWNRQNEYNSPVAQMERLKQAGLNPNLMYGQGVAGATGMAKEMPKYQAPRMQYDIRPKVDPMMAMSMYQDLRLKSAQVDLVKANTDKSKEQAITQQVLRTQKEVQTALTQIDLNFKSDTYQSRMDTIGYLNKRYEAQWQSIQKDLTIKEQVEAIKIEQLAQEKLRTNMRRYGLTDSDPFWSRMIAQNALAQGLSAEEFNLLIQNQWDKLLDARNLAIFMKILFPMLPMGTLNNINLNQ